MILVGKTFRVGAAVTTRAIAGTVKIIDDYGDVDIFGVSLGTM